MNPAETRSRPDPAVAPEHPLTYTHQDVEVTITILSPIRASAPQKRPLSKLPIPKHWGTLSSPREILDDTPLCLYNWRK
jgi:hypothetical protein